MAKLAEAVRLARAEAAAIFHEADSQRPKWEAAHAAGSDGAPKDFLWHAPLAGELTVHTPASLNSLPADSEALRLNWTSVNKLEWIETALGPAAQFPGRLGHSLELANPPVIAADRPFTLSDWLYLADAKHGGTLVSCIDENDHLRGWELHVRKRATFRLTHDSEGNALEVSAADEIVPNTWQHLAVTYDGSRRGSGVTFFINGQRSATKIQKDSLSGEILVKQPVRIGLRTNGSPLRGQMRDVYCYGRVLNHEEAGQLSSRPYESLAAVPHDNRTKAQQSALETWFRGRHSAEGRAALRTIAAREDELKKFTDSLATVMVMAERPEPREMFVFLRGRYDDPGERVTPGTPSVLPPLSEVEENNRLALARWLVSPEHPLTSRVLVNRLWERLFGVGLTRTSEDFGSQGEPPVYPDLLEWLAGQLVQPSALPAVGGQPAQPWDLKALQKLIVMSAVYQQSSVATPSLVERDPENRLLARGPRVRLSAETIRDQALAVSGLLSEKLGGPSVKPYQPPGVWEELLMLNTQYERDHGESLYRRTLYTLVRRTAQQPSLAIFDAPNREVCVVKRPRTNTPLQALCLRNDVTYVEAARVLAQLMMSQEETIEDRLRWGFRRVTSRWPQVEELAVLRSGFERRLIEFQRDPNAARKLIEQGDSPAIKHLDPVELAAYTTTASVLLNLDETITKQ